ncbi:hypothetical protein TrispH2_000032 [Trichoplax sp. H2]|uniref:Sperm microtubule inner protein 1 C-terminal domain-containing protein n=1 Tax=Trichoplax adhaerens TaxID=10228 RepID=B3RI74_TRIAD|nr:hypothetical protein TRIADDRAFT_52375 [Trichoplax adhaerens]EDV28969.1 hypothetical protein TRIADDRAFT_52375 [Trichoplax adhaerens]RDD47180.1 hypothetical protein TrispH2_000032 [Trichoplax sp. H2]|eukprot:XP_002108171.1 hypothetical protein TRIADDRAFT_52375 [Trichoplax adhaerens]
MARPHMDTRRQNFWTELIQKEDYIRLTWHERFRRIRKEKAELNFATKPVYRKEITRAIQSEKLPKLTNLEASSTLTRKIKVESDKVESDGPSASAVLFEMRPPSSKTKSLLYKGYSAIGEGRAAYLQARKIVNPEGKYEFPLTSSLEYGWKISDVNSDIKQTKFGRSRIVKDSFYRSNGVFGGN